MNGVTLDAGGLIAIDRGDRRILALIERSRQLGLSTTVPATALAQVVRRPAVQARIARLARDPGTIVVPLERRDATAVGILLARSGTTDIVDAHVVICARRTGQRVVTSDPADLQRLAPELELIAI